MPKDIQLARRIRGDVVKKDGASILLLEIIRRLDRLCLFLYIWFAYVDTDHITWWSW